MSLPSWLAHAAAGRREARERSHIAFYTDLRKHSSAQRAEKMLARPRWAA